MSVAVPQFSSSATTLVLVLACVSTLPWFAGCQSSRSRSAASRSQANPRSVSNINRIQFTPEFREWIRGRVYCYSCSVDFTSSRLTEDDPCIIPNNTNDITICSLNSKYCKAEVTRVNGVLVQFSRSCADESCFSESCQEKGFGIAKATCTYCCENEPDCGEYGPRVGSSSPTAPSMYKDNRLQYV